VHRKIPRLFQSIQDFVVVEAGPRRAEQRSREEQIRQFQALHPAFSAPLAFEVVSMIRL
jgi:hypothetical protein